MFARYFFIALGIASLLWVGYVAADLIDQRNAFTPTSVFGKEDGKVLILNRLDETEIQGLPFKTIPKNQEIIQLFKPLIKEINGLYISASRRVILMETGKEWSKNDVNELLKKTGLKFKSSNFRSFEIGGYIVECYKNILYFHDENIKTTTNDSWGNFDRKASVAIVDFSDEQPKVFEVYLRGEGKVEFITKNLKKLKGKQVDDKRYFASGIPRNIKKYHFLQKEYAAYLGGAYSKGPMKEWISKGFVSFQYKGKDAIVTDIIPGKSPIDVLNSALGMEESGEEHASFKGVRLTDQFPSSENSYFHVFVEGDYCILSEEEWVGSDIVGQLKLENTLSSEQFSLDEIYEDLPARVSERYIDGDTRYTKSVYKSKLLETHYGEGIFSNITIPVQKEENRESEEDDVKESDDSKTFNINAKINDFVAFNGKGNFITLTATGELMSYTGGRMNWVKNLNSKSIGGIHYNEEYQFILVTAKNALHLLDKTGKYVTGGPISIGSRTPTQSATLFNFKGKLYIAYPDNSGNVVVFDSKRKKLSTFPHGLNEISQPVEIWVSQDKLFFGVLNSANFVMIDAEKKQVYRSFALPGESISTISDNELFMLTADGSRLSCVNQKGIKQDVRSASKGKLLSSEKGRKETYMSNFNSGQIQFFGAQGAFTGKIKTDVKDAEFWNLQTINGVSYVSVVDGLENNAYLYELDGGKFVDRSFEGSKKCQLSLTGEDLLLTTVVDKYIVQYFIKK
ncbi:MAG: hypothetical protein RIT43_1727 [Bacteroidota bacterium]|jgi:hypothetical protein